VGEIRLGEKAGHPLAGVEAVRAMWLCGASTGGLRHAACLTLPPSSDSATVRKVFCALVLVDVESLRETGAERPRILAANALTHLLLGFFIIGEFRAV